MEKASSLEMPKSPSLTSPVEERKTLAGLRSRCSSRSSWWQYASAEISCADQRSTSGSENGRIARLRCEMRLPRSPPAAHSITMQRASRSTNDSLYPMMYGWCSACRIFTSCIVALRSDAGRPRIDTSLRMRLVGWLRGLTSQTVPNVPFPIRFTLVY